MAKLLCTILMLCSVCSTAGFAEETPPVPLPKESKTEAILNVSSVTEHKVNIKGIEVAYRATAGTLSQKNEKNEQKASIFYVAYNRIDGNENGKRPIAFCFNGGPGAASVWLHMGLLGPKRVLITQNTINIPPYEYIDNEYSLLDVTDLVFIDPVSTGYSRPVNHEDAKQFHGVEEDVKSVAEFIRLFTTQNSLWDSPKFLIGESYGTTRAALLVDHLQEELYMYCNGLILVSSVLDFQTIDRMQRNNDLSYILYLPTYTAAAWYHKKLPEDMLKLEMHQAVQEAKKFSEEYSLALLKGNQLSPEKRLEIIQKLTRYTGLSPEFIDRMDVRISLYAFVKELLKKEKRVIGRFDCRLTGIDLDTCASLMDYDPSVDAVIGLFTAAFNQYVRNDLQWKSDEEYRSLTDVSPWDYGKACNSFLYTAKSLRQAMSRNPLLEVFVANGYYDLATPQFATEYTFNHMNLDPSILSHVTMGNYDAGHMIFTDMPSLIKLSGDLHAFIDKIQRVNHSSPIPASPPPG